jgi:O-antigen ligase
MAAGLVACGVVAVGLAVTIANLDLSREVVVATLAVVLGGGFAFLAATRFPLFLTALVVVRASLDGLKLSGFGSSAISEPGVMVGGVLLMGCLLWLLAQREAGTLLPMSRSARWLLAFAAAAVVSSIGSADHLASFQASIRVTAGALSFVVIEQLLARRPRLVRGLLLAGALSLVLPAMVGFHQILTPDDLYVFTGVSRINSTFVHPNSFGAYLAIIAVSAAAVLHVARRRARTIAAVTGAAASVLLLFTYARGAWFAAVVGFGYLVVRYQRRLLPVLAGVGLLLVMLVPSVGSRLSDLESSPSPVPGGGTANSLEWRLGYWQEILPMAAEQPITGLGLDQVPQRTAAGAEPHNGFVQALVETGVLGLMALVGLTVAMWRDLSEARRTADDDFDRTLAVAATAAAAGILVQMLTENLLTQVAIHVYLWIPVAYATSRLVATRAFGPQTDRVPDVVAATRVSGARE